MRFSVASGTDNSLLQLMTDDLDVIRLSNADIELHTHEIDNNTRPYGVEGLVPIHEVYFGNSIGPHAVVDRQTYVVPANKFARLDMVTLAIVRQTASSALDIIAATCSIEPSGGSKIQLMELALYDNTVSAAIHESISPKIILEVGDTISLNTQFAGMGGTALYRMGYYLSEIDA